MKPIRRFFIGEHPWGLLAFALAWRIPYLGRASLWQDEMVFVRLANPAMPLRRMIAASWDVILSLGQLPLPYLAWSLYFRGMTRFFNDAAVTPWIARAPSVVLGVLGVYFVNRLARRLLDAHTACMAALLFAGLFFPVYYSREAYCYPLILFLAPYVLWELHRCVFDDGPRKRSVAGTAIGFTALAYTHLGSLMLPLAAFSVLGGLWLFARFFERDRLAAGRYCKAGIATGVSLVSILPFFARFAVYNQAHTTGAPYSLITILNDVIAKLLLGEHLGFALMAWLLLVTGLVGLLRPGDRQFERRFFSAILVVATLLLAVATSRSQYLSVRYFSPVAPLIIVVFAAGLRLIAAQLARCIRWMAPQHVGYGLTGLLLGYAFGAHLVPMYAMKIKEPAPFPAVAEWLNANLTPGTPYLWYSGYQLRWVPGFYPTPGLTAVSPYIHGPGPDELNRLDQRHRDFIRRFPVSAFIGPTHHPVDVDAGIWPWPKNVYARHAEVTDTSLKPLVARGIFIWEPGRQWTRQDGTMDIFYNTRADAITAAARRGEAVYYDFTGWHCEPVSGHPEGLWMDYAWLHPGPTASIGIRNLRDQPVSGRFSLPCAVRTVQPEATVVLRASLGHRPCGWINTVGGAWITFLLEYVTLPVGEWQRLEFSTTGSEGHKLPYTMLYMRPPMLMTKGRID